jgi:hypothetical protein
MRTTDPNTLIQQDIYNTNGGIRVPAQQFVGIHDAYILDTYATNPSINKQPGLCRVVLPVTFSHTGSASGLLGISGYSNEFALGPCVYPGNAIPPDRTQCLVGFIATQPNTDSSIDVRVLSFIGWSGSSSVDTLSPFLLMGA